MEIALGCQQLGRYVRETRTRRGWSMQQLVNAVKRQGCRLDTGQISRFEQGKRLLRMEAWIHVALVLGIPDSAMMECLRLRSEDSKDSEEIPDEKPKTMLRRAKEAQRQGFYLTTVRICDRVIETLRRESPRSVPGQALIDEGLLDRANAYRRLQMFSMAERDLHILVSRERQSAPIHARACLQLAYIHNELGDGVNPISVMEAEMALAAVRRERGLEDVEATALDVLARLADDRGNYDEAIELWREARRIYERRGDAYECLRIRINIAGAHVERRRIRPGMVQLQECLAEARRLRCPRLEALAFSNAAYGCYLKRDYGGAIQRFRQSEEIASRNGSNSFEISFFNTYYRREIELTRSNRTIIRMLSSRLESLRSLIRRRTREVKAYDSRIRSRREG